MHTTIIITPLSSVWRTQKPTVYSANRGLFFTMYFAVAFNKTNNDKCDGKETHKTRQCGDPLRLLNYLLILLKKIGETANFRESFLQY